jgi:hypothetical protein
MGKKIKVAKLGTVCKDRATELTGTLTHWIYNMDGHVDYLFQPKGLTEEGQPVDKLYLEIDRLKLKSGDFEDIVIPAEILGTQVTDKASGFTGMAVSFIRHINGCFHVAIQPKGLLAKNNSPIKRCEFDLRGCEGKEIKKLSEAEKKKSEKDEPSPNHGNFNKTITLEKIPQKG